MDIKIRRSKPSELDTLHAMCDKYLLDEDLKSIWSDDAIYWIAQDSSTNKIAGFGGMVESVRFVDTMRLSSAVVHPDYRGRGLQAKLIRVRLRYARRAGKNFVITDTANFNPASARNLIACGFRPYWPEVRWRGDYADYWCCSLQTKSKSKIRI